MRINHNIAALNTHRQLGTAQNAQSKSMEKLSSGLRINGAKDDAAGLAISEKMRGQIRGLDQASANAQDANSMIQTAEGALNETHDILQRMRELATQSANDTNTASDRGEIQKEVDQLAGEITRISNNTEFNTQNLVGGNMDVKFHVGANQGQNIQLKVDAMDAFTLGIAGTSTTATVADGATNITGTSLAGTTGDALVDGTTITVSTAVNTGTESVGSLTDLGTGDDKSLTITSAVGTAHEDVEFTLVSSGSADDTVVISESAGVYTITAGNTAAAADITTAINAHADFTGFSVTGDAVGDDFAGETLTLTGGAEANAEEQIVTLTDGTTTQTVVVADDASSVNVTTGAFEGLTFTTDDISAASGDINIAVSSGSAAVFNADGTIDEAAVAASGIDVSSQAAADAAITTINNAIETVSAERSKLGAVQNRLDHTINNLGTSSENLTAAESRIRDVDMAKEMMNQTKNAILAQASQAMLAQANQLPQGVLQLLQ
jgi:flagellin